MVRSIHTVDTEDTDRHADTETNHMPEEDQLDTVAEERRCLEDTNGVAVVVAVAFVVVAFACLDLT
jgi:hypothetical protein